jgi:hypothetical protein
MNSYPYFSQFLTDLNQIRYIKSPLMIPDRIPVRARFSAPVQTSPEARPASCTMGTGYLSRGIKRPGRGADHLPSSAGVKERVELYLYSPSGPSWPVLGRSLPLPFTRTFPNSWPIWIKFGIQILHVLSLSKCWSFTKTGRVKATVYLRRKWNFVCIFCYF